MIAFFLFKITMEVKVMIYSYFTMQENEQWRPAILTKAYVGFLGWKPAQEAALYTGMNLPLS